MSAEQLTSSAVSTLDPWMDPQGVHRYAILGATVHGLTIGTLNELIGRAIETGSRWVIAHHNINSLVLCRRDATFREFYASAEFVHIDGMPLVWMARLLGHPLRREHRVTYVDWVPSLMAESARRGWRVFLLGGRPGVAARAAKGLERRNPGLATATAHGYFDVTSREQNERVLETIDRCDPHILMIGMGMPRQEKWILRHRSRIAASVILPCGGAIDYAADSVPVPPRWSGSVGLEWAFRLCAEPSRLWKRYLLEPWPLVLPLAREVRQRYRRVPGEMVVLRHEACVATRNHVNRELLSPSPEFRPIRRLIERLDHGSRKRRRVAHRHQTAVASIGEHFTRPATIGADNGSTAGHGFDEDVAKALPPRRQHEQGGSGDQTVRICSEAEQLDGVAEVERLNEILKPFTFLSLPEHDESQRAGPVHEGHGAKHGLVVLDGIQATGGDDHGRLTDAEPGMLAVHRGQRGEIR
jgi:N-acetylglucosaminyldiphosphoundecaprenol N-acetyl-beta-D-mannosaminyltransferase